MTVKREALWLWAAMVLGISDKRIWEESAKYGDIARFCQALKNGKVLTLSRAEYDRARKLPFERAELILQECENKNTGYYCYESEGYPAQLRRIPNPPAVLFFKGNLDFLNDKCIITVVGTRDPSEYSLRVTDELCRELIRRGFTLAGGFAEGIDQRVNAVSIAENSFPVAVCGAALDRDHPKGSSSFKEEVAAKGVVISEYFPGCTAASNAFINRNRISVGLSCGVLFIEAGRNSHGLDNYYQAVRQGKPVFVVPPHDILDERYSGQKELLRKGCLHAFDADDIVYSVSGGKYYDVKSAKASGEFVSSADSGFFGDARTENSPAGKRIKSSAVYQKAQPEIKPAETDLTDLDRTQTLICRLLKDGDMQADEIADRLGLDAAQVFTELTCLELEGIVRASSGNKFGLV